MVTGVPKNLPIQPRNIPGRLSGEGELDRAIMRWRKFALSPPTGESFRPNRRIRRVRFRQKNAHFDLVPTAVLDEPSPISDNLWYIGFCSQISVFRGRRGNYARTITSDESEFGENGHFQVAPTAGVQPDSRPPLVCRL